MAKKKATDATPKKRKRSKPDWAPAFLRRLAETSNIKAACAAAGICRSTAYRRRDSDAAFAQAMAEALDDSVDDLELEARRRAYEGCERPVFHQGSQCGTVREYSDTLMIFLLKAHRPEKYREIRESRMTGPNGGPLEANVNHASKQPMPSPDAVLAYLGGLASRPAGTAGGDGPVHANGVSQRLDTPPAAP